MLKQLSNRKTQKTIWIILTILILPAFMLWGTNTAIRNKKQRQDAGRLFGKTITLQEYQDALEATRLQAMLFLGENFPQMEKYLNLPAQAWDRLILLHEVKKRGIKSSDQEVVERVEAIPAFQRKGVFDPEIYKQKLNQPRLFEEQIRQNIMLSKLFKALTQGVTLSDDELKTAYQKENEKLSISYISFQPADFISRVNPQEKELRDFFQAKALDFKQPLTFSIEYTAFQDQEKAQDFQKILRKKKGDLAASAKDQNIELKETGFFGMNDPIPGIGWSPLLLNAISSLKGGQTSGILEADGIFYIIRLKSRKDPHLADYESVKEKVTDAYLTEKSRELAEQKAQETLRKLKDKNAGSQAMEATAKAGNGKYGTSGLFSLGGYAEGLGASDMFYNAAKLLKPGQVSDLISAPSGFYIIALKELIPADEAKFQKDKEDFRQKALEQKQQEVFGQFLEDLRKKAVKE